MTVITTDLILGDLKKWVEEKIPVDAHKWLDAAQKLTALMGDEHDRLFEMQREIADMKVQFIEGGATVAKANLLVERLNEYTRMQQQRAKIERVEEMVRIAKLQARMKDTEMRGQF